MPHQQTNLLLSSDAKPRLKWTAELHHRFVDAVKQLGGPHKATPKSLMRIMGIQGLTLYHLKSHLQKYRLGRSHHVKQQGENSGSNSNCNAEEAQINDVQALEMQRKLEQQIEVQRHLQLRIEAQGRYLQSVLKKAQETLSRYSACAVEVADSGCTTSSLTESEGSMLKEKLLGCSMEISLTFSHKNNQSDDDDGRSAEEWSAKKNIDLNELDSGPTGIDLNLNFNSNALQLFGSTF